LVPTGGVSLRTAADFIRAGAAALGVGTDLIDIAVLKRGEDHLISERAHQFLHTVQQARASLVSDGDVNSTVTRPWWTIWKELRFISIRFSPSEAAL